MLFLKHILWKTNGDNGRLLLLFGLLQGSMNTEKMKVQIIQLNALSENQIRVSMNAENTISGFLVYRLAYATLFH